MSRFSHEYIGTTDWLDVYFFDVVVDYVMARTDVRRCQDRNGKFTVETTAWEGLQDRDS